MNLRSGPSGRRFPLPEPARPGSFVRVSADGKSFEEAPNVALFVVDNRRPGTTIYGYTASELVDGFAGEPAVKIYLPEEIAGVGHGLSVLGDGSLLVATSERLQDGHSNLQEAFLLVPPGASGEQTSPPVLRAPCGALGYNNPYFGAGARSVAVFPDGSFYLTRGGLINSRITRSDFEAGRYSAAKTIFNNGSLLGWDCQIVADPTAEPGSNYKVWCFAGGYLSQIDLGVSGVGPGPAGSFPCTKLAIGSNLGFSAWGGCIAFDALGGVYIVRSDNSSVIYLDNSTLSALTSSPVTPTITRTITSDVWSAVDLNRESLWTIDLDINGNAWVATYSFGVPLPLARLYCIDKSDLEAGGSVTPSRTIVLPTTEAVVTRFAPGYGLFLR